MWWPHKMDGQSFTPFAIVCKKFKTTWILGMYFCFGLILRFLSSLLHYVIMTMICYSEKYSEQISWQNFAWLFTWTVKKKKKRRSTYQAQRAQTVSLHHGSLKCKFRKGYMVAGKQLFSNPMQWSKDICSFSSFLFCFCICICCCTGQRLYSPYLGRI